MSQNKVKVFENEQFGQIRVDCNDVCLVDVTDMYIYHKLTLLTVKQRKVDAFFDATDLLDQYNCIIEQANNSNLPLYNKKNNSHNKIEDFFEWKGYKKRMREGYYVFGVCDDSHFVKIVKDGDDVKVWLHATMIDIYLRWISTLMDVPLVGVEDISLAIEALSEQRKICNKGREIY